MARLARTHSLVTYSWKCLGAKGSMRWGLARWSRKWMRRGQRHR